jgi:hypothetical protein
MESQRLLLAYFMDVDHPGNRLEYFFETSIDDGGGVVKRFR